MATLDDVATLARRLPDVTEEVQRGNLAWKVTGTGTGGRAFAWERPFSKADLRRFGDTTPPSGPILAVRLADLHEKEAALAAHPAELFTIPHFDGYPAVLIQLDAASTALLQEILTDSWLACASPAAIARLNRGE